MVVPAFGCSRDGIQPPESILFCRRGLAPILPLRRDDPGGWPHFLTFCLREFWIGVLVRGQGSSRQFGETLFCSSSALSLVFIPGWPTGSRAEVPWRDVSLSHRCSKREGMTLLSPGPELAGVSGAGQVPSGAAAGRCPSAASGSVRRPRVTPSSLDGDRLLDGGRVESTAPGTAQLPGADRFVTVLAGASPPGNHPTTPGAGFGVITCRSLHHAG